MAIRPKLDRVNRPLVQKPDIIHQCSRHHELEDNGSFANFKLLLVKQNARSMARIWEALVASYVPPHHRKL